MWLALDCHLWLLAKTLLLALEILPDLVHEFSGFPPLKATWLLLCLRSQSYSGCTFWQHAMSLQCCISAVKVFAKPQRTGMLAGRPQHTHWCQWQPRCLLDSLLGKPDTSAGKKQGADMIGRSGLERAWDWRHWFLSPLLGLIHWNLSNQAYSSNIAAVSMSCHIVAPRIYPGTKGQMSLYLRKTSSTWNSPMGCS